MMPLALTISRNNSAKKRLAMALGASLALHGSLFTLYKTAPHLLDQARRLVAELLQTITDKPIELVKVEEPPPAEVPTETPMTFVEVDPALALQEPPKEAKHYSTHNTRAANENPRIESTMPKIEGTQKRTVRTDDNPKPSREPVKIAKVEGPPAPPPKPVPQPLQPTIAPEPQPEPPKPTEPIGDVALAKPAPAPNPLPPEKAPELARVRPRTLAQAMQQNPMLAGRKVDQDGGVRRRARVALDARESPFGRYDAAFIAAVQERWYQLLENNTFMGDRRGKVVVDFRLNYDGRITQLKAENNTVGELLGLLCQKAIMDPSPFPRWPSDMRRMVGTDYREVRFTFYYD